jgi:hypothetical protein
LIASYKRDRRGHAFRIEFEAVAALDSRGVADAIGHMQHRIGIGEPGVERIGCRYRLRKQWRQARMHRCDAITGECGDLQPALGDD